MSNVFLSLIARCRNEPYVAEFVNHYIHEGVDKIHIIDDDSDRKYYEKVEQNDKVKIYYEKDIIRRKLVNKIYKDIRDSTEWLIYVDIDEYITTRKHINNTIRDELEAHFRDAECVLVPWVMMSCNNQRSNPASLLESNIYRWNHDKEHINSLSKIDKFRCRYSQIEVKSIFRPKYFQDIFDHIPLKPAAKFRCVDAIGLRQVPLTPFHQNLRERDIENGHLLCYHYRLISVENCLYKIANNIWYRRFTVNDLMSNDYAEIKDETLKNKSIKRKKAKNSST